MPASRKRDAWALLRPLPMSGWRQHQVIPQGQYEALHRTVFGHPTLAVYAVLDGAMIEGLPARLAQVAPDAACLFEGSLDPMLSAAAPYVIKLAPQSAAAQLALKEGWNDHWGIVLVTDASVDLRTVRSHLVLDAAARREFFGPIHGVYVEGRTPDSALYFARDGKPEPQSLPLPAAA